MGNLSIFIRRLLLRTMVGAILLGLAVATGAYWLAQKDPTDFELARQERLQALNAERAQFQTSLTDIVKRLARLSGETTAQEARLKQADSVIARLNELESTWEKYFGNRAQQKANAEQIERMQAVREDAAKKAVQAKQDYTRTVWERDGAQIKLAETDSKIKAAEVKRSRIRYYVEAAWDWEQPWAVAGSALFVFGPIAWRILRFFLRRGG